jgi:hypothetical protein
LQTTASPGVVVDGFVEAGALLVVVIVNSHSL